MLGITTFMFILSVSALVLDAVVALRLQQAQSWVFGYGDPTQKNTILAVQTITRIMVRREESETTCLYLPHLISIY